MKVWALLTFRPFATFFVALVVSCGSGPNNVPKSAPERRTHGPNEASFFAKTSLHPAFNDDLSPFPLSTAGRYVVDRRGRRFHVKAVNWYGSHLEKEVPEGLDKQDIGHIIHLIKKWGFNTVRLPFSNQMLKKKAPVSAKLVAANPSMQNLTPLEIFDRTVDALADAGLAVILNNHTTFSEHCCAFDTNGLWYHSGASPFTQSFEEWQRDWLFLIDRYRNVKAVVGADLRNEVRTMKYRDSILPLMPSWGDRGKNDWHDAAQTLGREINRYHPDLLIIVEGINWTGMIPVLGSGGRPHLRPVANSPIHLKIPRKLVYAAHNYAYVGPRHNGDPKTSRGQITYGEMTPEEFVKTIDEEWGYLLNPGHHYTAPVWLSEFGAPRANASREEKIWFTTLAQEISDRELDFAYWPLNPDSYGLVRDDWSDITSDDWRYELIKKTLDSTHETAPPTGDLWHSFDIRHGDDDQSDLATDWLPGAHKGACGAGYRLVGVSRDTRGLCSNRWNSHLGAESNEYVVMAVQESSKRERSGGDWASQRTKYECPSGYYGAGISRHYWGISGLLCLRSKGSLSHHCETRWFDQEESRASLAGGDFARGALKGQCSDQEYIAGIAHIDGTASAMLCCRITGESTSP